MTEHLDIEAIRHNALSLRQEASAPGGDPAMLTLAEDAVRLCDEVERLRDVERFLRNETAPARRDREDMENVDAKLYAEFERWKEQQGFRAK